MRVNVFFSILATGMILSLSACNNDANEASEIVNTNELVVLWGDEPSTDIAFGEADIKSFNLVTREIKFVDSTMADGFNKPNKGYIGKLTFYLDKKSMFVADVYLPTANLFSDNLIFIKEDSKFYLLDGYPRGSWEGLFTGDVTEASRTANVKKRNNEWNIFVNYLSDAGKTINEEKVNVDMPIDNTLKGLVVTGEDIKSFNTITREIAFTTAFDEYRRTQSFSAWIINIDGEILFDSIQRGGEYSSCYFQDMVMYEKWHSKSAAHKFYLYDSNPDIAVWPDWTFNKAHVMANIQKRKPAMNKFIKYLSDAGKIVDDEEEASDLEPFDDTRIEAIITDDGIKTFNVTTREITFTTLEDSIVRSSNYITIQLGTELTLDTICVKSDMDSNPHPDLTLYYNIVTSKFYLRDSYPVISNWPTDNIWNISKDDVIANIQNRKPAMDKFINYLLDAGKIVKPK